MNGYVLCVAEDSAGRITSARIPVADRVAAVVHFAAFVTAERAAGFSRFDGWHRPVLVLRERDGRSWWDQADAVRLSARWVR